MRYSLATMLMAATASVVSASPQLNKFWDHTTRGEDVQSSSQEKRGVDGELANYGLRVRKQDPNKLGIDRVRQYSGYLDNDVQDKHVFFCEKAPAILPAVGLILTLHFFFLI